MASTGGAVAIRLSRAGANSAGAGVGNSAGFAPSSAGLTLAASLPSQTISGNYLEARTADVYTGPCFANAETGLVGQLAVMGWKIAHGSWQGVDLSGLSVVGVVRAESTLGNVEVKSNPAKAVLIIDSKADPEQRLALAAFAKHMSNSLLSDVVRIETKPIESGGNSA